MACERRDEIVLACADYPDLVVGRRALPASASARPAAPRPLEAAMAIAGPITGDIVRMTNHVWQFSAAHTRQQLELAPSHLLNDFTALAMAVRHLPARISSRSAAAGRAERADRGASVQAPGWASRA